MKKVITIIGIFGLIFVQAQVGINKDKPDATLDIVAEKTDGSQVEGLLVPRISKEAAYNMAIASPQPQESNMVYINNANYSFPAGTLDAQKATVADITEKGYYFWNGDKWVKTAGKDGAEWIYKGDSITLKRSGMVDFKNKVYYDKNGLYKNYTRDFTRFWNPNTLKFDTIYPKDITSNIISRLTSDTPDLRHLNYNYLTIDSYQGGVQESFVNSNLVTTISKDNTQNHKWVIGSNSTVRHNGRGDVAYMLGLASSATISGGKSTKDILGARISSGMYGTSSVKVLGGIRTYSIDNANGTAYKFTGLLNYLNFTSRGSSTISYVEGVVVAPKADVGNSSQIGILKGFYYAPSWSSKETAVQHEYGIYLNDVVKGTEKNYAIYTKRGKVRFGDTLYIDRGHSWAVTDVQKGNREFILLNATPSPSVGDMTTRITTNIDAVVNGERKDKYRGHSIDFGYKDFHLHTNPFIMFRVSPEQGSPTNEDMTEERMRITSSGRVGIGTNDPATKLDVNGAIKVGSNSTASGVPTHTAPNGTIIYHNDSFYGRTSNGWKKLHN